MTVKIWPPAVIVPVRAIEVLGATLNEMSPLIVPELPPLMVIHGTLLTAVQPQVGEVVRVKRPLPPPAAAE